MAKLVILIAGNICSGKTTLVEYLHNNSNLFRSVLSETESVRVIKEFIDPESLKLFYMNRQKYTSIFESSCLIGRLVRQSVAEQYNGICIFDRGIVEGSETFAKNSYLEGYMSYESYQDYVLRIKKAFDDLSRIEENQNKWLEQLIIYLKVDDVNILVERNKKRATEGEIIPKEYFEKLNQNYNCFFSNINKTYADYGLKAPEVLTIDASTDFSQNSQYLKDCADLILSKTNEILYKKQTTLK